MLCRTCRDEVRFGRRADQPGWWHRGDVDHDTFPVPAPVDDAPEPLPEVEIWGHSVEPQDDIVPGGVRTIVNLLARERWQLRRLTHARGPYVGAKDKLLSISDTIVLGAREADSRCERGGLDRGPRVAVASWRDGKFDFAYVGVIEGGKVFTQPANNTEMKTWIKGSPKT